MVNFNEPTTVKTVFGKIEVVYVAPGEKKEADFDFSDTATMVKVPSHYVAKVLGGDFNGWSAVGLDRAAAVKNVVVEIAARHAINVTSDAQ